MCACVCVHEAHFTHECVPLFVMCESEYEYDREKEREIEIVEREKELICTS